MQRLQKHLELCYNAILRSAILKQKLLFYYLSLSSVSLTLPLSQTLSPTSLSLRLLPLLCSQRQAQAAFGHYLTRHGLIVEIVV